MTAVIRPYNIAGALAVCRNLPSNEQRVHEALTGHPYNADEAAVESFHYPGMHWVGINGAGEPIFVGGFIRQRDGVFRTWFFATELAWQTPGVTALVRDYIRRMLNQKLAHRIETVTLARCQRARDWYVKIGLQLEATLRGYSATGEDAVMYVATRPLESL